jgi:class 3 adenylate cyclase/tetratricopeptide (TPR) repeat protein
MSLNATSKEKPVQNFLTSLMEAYPDASMRDIAVLFTDVVGSTTFFKTHGDIRGREMLRTHHHMAMSIVEDYGGSLIKEVGDSVLVYFPDPAEALKAAISMQHRFLLHNQQGTPDDQIHVRIGLHHGKVIVEEKDIYGDVVNVAAKLTNLAGGDQIFVSHEVYATTRSLPSIQFERIDFWNMKNVPDGLTIYKVVWENAQAGAPARRILVVLVPDPLHPEIGTIVDATDLPPREEDDPVEDACLSVERSHDNKPVLVYTKTSAAVQASERIFAGLTGNQTPAGMCLPLKIFITNVSARDEETILSSGPGPELDTVPYGSIYVTADVCQQMRSHNRVAGGAVVEFESSGSLFRISGRGQLKENLPDPELSTSINPAPQGTYSPCFYCGSRRHKITNCPSRTLTESGRSIHLLGYLPMPAIEELALSLEKSLSDIEAGANPFSVESVPSKKDLAAHAYYDLKSLYQFRFSQIVWNSNAGSWDTLRAAQAENQGGFAWLAQDSLRVSNYDKARSFLKLALERKPKDYKAFCVSGFLNMELENMPAAISDLTKALEFADTNIRKIYISMLLSRLYKLSGDSRKFKSTLSEARLLDSACHEAVYEDIVLGFEENNEKSALQKLIRLIGEDRNFFVVSLIDPELSQHRNTIYVHLTELLAEAKKDALSHFEDARKDFARSRTLLPLAALKSIDPVVLEIEKQIQSESYFGCLDVPHRCARIKIMCKNALNEQIHTIAAITKELKARFQKAEEFLKSYRYAQLTQKHRGRLAHLKGSLSQIGDVRYFESSGEFENCFHVCQDISKQLSSLESRLELLDIAAQAIRMCFKFLKSSSISFSIVFFIGIFLFPLISDPINTMLAKLDISLFQNAWSLQKSFLILGGIVSIVASFLVTIREVLTAERKGKDL